MISASSPQLNTPAVDVSAGQTAKEKTAEDMLLEVFVLGRALVRGGGCCPDHAPILEQMRLAATEIALIEAARGASEEAR